MLFKKKRHLLNSHILHLTFSLVGTLDSGRETSSIPLKAAFENLLCDLEVSRVAVIVLPCLWLSAGAEYSPLLILALRLRSASAEGTAFSGSMNTALCDV